MNVFYKKLRIQTFEQYLNNFDYFDDLKRNNKFSIFQVIAVLNIKSYLVTWHKVGDGHIYHMSQSFKFIIARLAWPWSYFKANLGTLSYFNNTLFLFVQYVLQLYLRITNATEKLKDETKVVV